MKEKSNTTFVMSVETL